MAIGDLMVNYPGMVTTFYDDFSSGLAQWPESKFPWGRKVRINGEDQYYADNSQLAAADKTIFINGAGNLVLRTIPTPSYYADEAKIVLNGYVIVSAAGNSIIVEGENYYDKPTYTSQVGIGYNPDPQGMIDICGNGQQPYTNISTVSMVLAWQNLAVWNTAWGPFWLPITSNTNDPNPFSGTPTIPTIPAAQGDIHSVTYSDGNIIVWAYRSTSSQHQITLSGPVPGGITFNDPNCRANVYKCQPYISGILTTQNTAANGNSGFSQKFGRYKARVKTSKGQGHFPAFWRWPDYDESVQAQTNVQKSVEDDIFEILGHAPDISYHTMHSPGFDMRPGVNGGSPLLGTYQGVDQWKTSHMQQFQRIDGRDHSADFYWVVFDHFTDNSVAWYVETAPGSGQMIEVANSLAPPTADDGIIDPKMLILNNAFGSEWSWNQSTLYDANYPGAVGQTAPPWDFEIAEVCVQQFDGAQTGGGTPTPTTPQYTGETVVGPPGTIADVVVCVPTHETDRQGTVHEVEAKICYRPSNILPENIGLKWGLTYPAPIAAYFVDGDDKSWRVRVHLTTFDTSPLPQHVDINCFISQIYLIP